MPRREDDVDRGAAAPASRTLLQAGGFLLAVGATLAVLFTDDAQLLKVAVVAVAWAFVLATFTAGRRGTDQLRAAAREGELRRAYERDLDREVAARREYELELENQLRKDTEDAVRGDLADLRGEIARLSSMRGDLAALAGVRDEVARVAALHEDVAALAGLRSELGQLAALREDMARLRAELTDQLSSEMLVERIVMRTQASRLPGEGSRFDGPARVLDGGAPRSDDAPPRELTGGWPAARLDEPHEPQQFERVRTTGWSSAAPPPTTALPAAPPPVVRTGTPAPPPAAGPPAVPYRPPAPQPAAPAFERHDRAAAHQDDPYLGAGRSRRGDDAPRRRRTDEAPGPVPGQVAPTTQHLAVPPPWAAPQPTGADRAPASDASGRLAQILAENGVSPSSGGRRRRYREDGESDDVLARVLGR